MPSTLFVFSREQPFNYRAFAKYMVTCPNVLWTSRPGCYCKRPRFRRVIELELGVSEDDAKKIVDVMLELGFIGVDSDNDVYVVEALRNEK